MGRFGFKCELFADSDPCPDLVPGAVEREPAAGAPHKSERSALGDCANEVIPCQQCATDAPCPFLGGLQSLRIDSADTAGVAAATGASAAAGEREENVHTHVWLSLGRRALWRNAQPRAPAQTRAGSAGDARGIGAAIPLLRRVLWDRRAEPLSAQRQGSEHAGDGGTAGASSRGDGAREEEDAPSIAPERLALHRHAKSCWIAADGHVYDATLFLARHPAGSEVWLGPCLGLGFRV